MSHYSYTILIQGIGMANCLQIVLIITGLFLETQALCHHYYDDICTVECDCQVNEVGVESCSSCKQPCQKEKETECIHGVCTPLGCVCSGCWKGEECNQYQNLFVPVFSDTLYTKQVLLYTRGVVRGIAAFDRDRAECTLRKHADCPCSKVIYGIIKGDDSERFQINPDTGELAYSAEDIGHEIEIKVIIVARNYDGRGYLMRSNKDTGYATIRIQIKETIDTGEIIMLREILPYPNIYSWRTEDDLEPDDDAEQLEFKAGAGSSILIGQDDALMSYVGNGHSRIKRAVVISDFEVSLVITEVVTHIKPEDIFFFEAVVTVPIGMSDLNVFINTSLTSNRAVFDVLDLEVTSIGSNLNTSADPVITMASSFANFEMDSVVIDFGQVTNYGTDMNTLTPSQILISFATEVLHNAEMIHGNVYNVSACVDTVNGNLVEFISLTAVINMTVDTTTTNITNSVSPTTTVPVSVDTFQNQTSSITDEMTSGVTSESTTYQPIIFSVDTTVVELTTEGSFINVSTVSPTQEVTFTVSITTPVGQHNITLELASGFDGLPLFHICSIDDSILFGENIINTDYTIIKTSTFDNYQMDAAKIYFGLVTNTGYNTSSYQPSQITINFTALVLNNINLIDGDTCDFTASVDQDGAKSNSSTISFQALIYNLVSGYDPLVSVTGPNILALGQVATWTIDTVLVDGSNDLTLDIYGSGNSPINICSSRYKSKGSNLGCYNDHVITVDPSIAGPTGFVYTFDEILNSDYLYGFITDDANNTITLEILGSIPKNGQPGSTFTFTVDSYIDGIFRTTTTFDVTEGPPSFTTTVLPVVQVTKVSTNQNQITKGSSVLVYVDIYVQPNTVDIYSLQVTTTTSLSTICDIRIVSKGSNFPCNDILEVDNTTSYTSLDGNLTFSMVTRDIGLITSMTNEIDIMDVDNKITVAVVIQASQDSSATTSDTIVVTAAVTSDNLGTASSLMSMMVINSIISSEVNSSVHLTSLPPEPLPVQISETVAWKIRMELPVTSDRFDVRAFTQITGNEARLTVVSAEYTFIGKDLSCNDNLKTLSWVKSTHLPSQQMRTINADLGYISYQGMGNSIDGNILEIEFTFKVADHPANTDGSNSILIFTVTSDGGVSETGTGDVTIQVLGSETASIIFNTWSSDSSLIQNLAGETVTVYGNISLQNTSTAHASNVKVLYMLPHFVKFASPLNYTHVQPIVSEDAKGLELLFPLVTFEDLVQFSFKLVLDPTGYFDPGTENIYTVLPVDVTYTSLQRPDRSDTSVHYFPEPFVLEFLFDVPSSIVSIGPLTQSCQWFSSSDESTYTATSAVSTSSVGWRPGVRGPPYCAEEFLQLYLGNQWQIEKISVMSPGDSNLDYITHFIVQTSDNGLTWDTLLENGTNIVKMFNVSFDNSVKQINDAYDFVLTASEIFSSRYIKIVPKGASLVECRSGLRIEFYGFKKTNDLADICTLPVTGRLAVHGRTLVVDPIKGTLFVCIETGVSEDVLCSKTEDLGVSWEEIDDAVSNVVGVISNTSRVLGVSYSGATYMCSYDNGFDWSVCTDDEATEIMSDSDFTSYKIIPFDDLSSLSLNDWKTNYGFTYNSKDITGSVSGIIVDDGTINTIAWWGTTDWLSEL